MRILHITPYYAPEYAFGGVVSAVTGLTRALARRGHAVTVLTTSLADAPAREALAGVNVVRAPGLLPALRRRANLGTPAHFAQLAAPLLAQADVVHCHEFRTVENLVVTPLAARAGLPLVLSPHGTLDTTTGRGSLKRLWDRTLSSAVALRFAHVSALSAAERADIEALWPQFGRRQTPAAFSVIPNGVDPAEFAALPDRAAARARFHLGEGPVGLFLARLHPRKGLLPLVQAFRAAAPPDAHLLIAGPDEGALAGVRPLLDERMHLLGTVTGEDRRAVFAAADLLALPAVGEGLPVVALEAMAAGLPVLLSPGCNLPEAAAAGAGLEVPPEPEALAAALRFLLGDPARRAAMGAAGRALVAERFTWAAVAAAWESVYRELSHD